MSSNPNGDSPQLDQDPAGSDQETPSYPGYAQGYPPQQPYYPPADPSQQPYYPQAYPPGYSVPPQQYVYQPGVPPPLYTQPTAPQDPGDTGEIPQRPPGTLERWKARGGVLGGLATALLFLLKIGGPIIAVLSKLKVLLILGKLLLGGGSMLLSMWLESKMFGWPLAVGIVILIFIHECGHAMAAKIRGIPTGIMVFIPFMGAFVTRSRHGNNLEEDAFIGIMGPVVGSIASLAAFLLYFPTNNQFWLELGEWGFFINLFNLLPTPPLDGGWIVPLFSPKLLAVGMVIAVAAGFTNPLIWLLLVFSIPRIIAGWTADPKSQPFYQVRPQTKWIYGIAYIGLAALLAFGQNSANGIMLQ